MSFKRSFARKHIQSIKPTRKTHPWSALLLGAVILACIGLTALDGPVIETEAKTSPKAIPVAQVKRQAEVFATVYVDKGIMANNKRVHEGAAACPRAWKLGTQFILDGVTYTCEDHTSQRVEKMRSLPTVDLWKPWTAREARQWGAPRKVIEFK